MPFPARRTRKNTTSTAAALLAVAALCAPLTVTAGSAAAATPPVRSEFRPASIIDATGFADSFYHGSDGDLWESSLSPAGQWLTPAADLIANWNQTSTTKATPMAGDPATAVRGDGTLDVFYTGTDGHLEQFSLSPWGSPSGQVWSYYDLTAGDYAPGNLVGDPAVTDNPANGEVDVFLRSTAADGSGHLWQTYLPPAGGPWQHWDMTAAGKASAIAGNPSTIRRTNGTLDVFYRNSSGHLQESNTENSWTTWDLTSMGFASPAVTSDAPALLIEPGGQEDVFYPAYTYGGGAAELQESYLDSTSWTWWEMTAHGQAPANVSEPAAAVEHNGHVDVYYRDTWDHNSLGESWLDSDGWHSGNLSADGHAPANIVGGPSVMVGGGGGTSTRVYTADATSADLNESFTNSGWHTWDMTRAGVASTVA